MHKLKKCNYLILGLIVICSLTNHSFSANNCPPGESCYEVGYMSRPLLMGIGGPELDHHNALAKMYGQVNATFQAGLFADSMVDALAGWIVFETISWDDPTKFDYGWVDGHIEDEGATGGENLSESDEDGFWELANSLAGSWGDALPLGYNLVLYNCQDWAAEQL